MEIAGSILAYAGALTILGGLFPSGSRMRWLGGGAFLMVAGFALPVQLSQVARQDSQLDRFAPSFQFNEVHDIEIEAGPAAVYRAIKQTTAQEVRLFGTLTWIRRFGRPGPENILNVPDDRPILEVATSSGFLWLADHPEQELVAGTLVRAPRGARRPGSAEEYAAIEGEGYAKAVLSFSIEAMDEKRCRVRTETRVFATDSGSARRFAAYWRVIYPGSSLIRVMWLRAIRDRAISH